jgi:helix-turn-helix protein
MRLRQRLPVVSDYIAVVMSDVYAKEPTKRFLLADIALMQNANSGCYLSRDTIARRVGVSLSTVKRCLRQAKDDGFLRSQSFRDHLGHEVVQRWVNVKALPSRGSLDEPQPRVKNTISRGSPEAKPRVKSQKPEGHLGEPEVLETRVLKSMSIKESSFAPSALIEKITIQDITYSPAEFREAARKYGYFNSAAARLTFADGAGDFALIQWDSRQRTHILKARVGGAVFAL